MKAERGAALPSSPFVGTSAKQHAPSFPSRAVGVGHVPAAPREAEPTLSLVGSSNVARSQTTPFRIVPEAGKVRSDVDAPSSKDPWHVLKEDEPGS